MNWQIKQPEMNIWNWKGLLANLTTHQWLEFGTGSMAFLRVHSNDILHSDEAMTFSPLLNHIVREENNHQ